MTADRLERERVFHDERFGGDDAHRRAAKKYYTANQAAENKYRQIILERCNGKHLLEYGCGAGSESVQWLENGAKLSGIDISSEGIEVARAAARELGYDAEYYVMDAEAMEFDDGTFDVVVGTGILHHLDLQSCYAELSRVLVSDGSAVFIEPLGHNPFINLYRRLTPSMRTEDEHPLRIDDLSLLDKYFNSVEVHYFTLFSLLSVPFRNMAVGDSIYSLLRKLDQQLFRLPGLGRFAWIAVIHAQEPV